MTLGQIGLKYKAHIKDPHIADMFYKCFMNTYETTVMHSFDDEVFVITGDIPAMWLRDSSAQVRHYLHFVNECQEAYELILGLLRCQMRRILIDPYANAFNKGPDNVGHRDDVTNMNPYIWERKYEIDSLCYPIVLAYDFWQEANSTEQFDSVFYAATLSIVSLWETEQNHVSSPYMFERSNCPPSDTLPNNGFGAPVEYTGMTWSGFRPSDDACEYGYHVPSNMFAMVALERLAQIFEEIYSDSKSAERARKLRGQIKSGIDKFAIVEHDKYGQVFAYEVDGKGNFNLMDDANVPSLLSLPYIGCVDYNDFIYINTRKMILSEDNPFFYCGSFLNGIGSPHTRPGYVWPISLCMQGLTDPDNATRESIIRLIAKTDAGCGFVHESVNVNNPMEYSRPWFAWANSLFAELVIRQIDAVGGIE